MHERGKQGQKMNEFILTSYTTPDCPGYRARGRPGGGHVNDSTCARAKFSLIQETHTYIPFPFSRRVDPRVLVQVQLTLFASPPLVLPGAPTALPEPLKKKTRANNKAPPRCVRALFLFKNFLSSVFFHPYYYYFALCVRLLLNRP